MVALILCSVLAAAPVPDTVVVGSEAQLAALQPWIAHRRAQGHQLAFVTRRESPEQIRAAIRQIASRGKLRNILLVGDAHPNPSADHSVPTYHAESTVTVRWGSEPQLATDNWYADLDDDQLPDVAIGRLTADLPHEVAVMADKILDYERAARRGASQRRLNFVAGVGGFGALADSILENTTRKFLTDGIPAEYQVSMTYGSWRSPFCPDPREFHDTTLDRFNEGCLFWVYIGHGHRTFLDRVRVPGGAFPIFDTDDVDELLPQTMPPIAVFLACYTGAFDGPRDCLAEEMLKAKAGPVAVLAGSRVTMPYAMAVMGNELLGEYFQNRPATLGELVLQAKRRMAASMEAEEGEGGFNRRLLDALAATISPSKDLLDDERREHVLLFNLLGDPMLRLRHGESIRLETSREITAGDTLQVVCESSIVGSGKMELVCRRDRWKQTPPRRSRFEATDMALDAYSDSYAAANDRRWLTSSVDLNAGSTTIHLAVPRDAHGPCHVRVFLESDEQHALGSSSVFVRRPVSPKEATSPGQARASSRN